MRRKNELRDVQQDIIDALYENDEKICVLRPGGGKTVCGLTAVNELISNGEIRHALVTAPKRVTRIVWPAEIFEWEHCRNLRFKVLSGTPAQRVADLATSPGRDLTIIGHDVLDWLIAQLDTYPPDHPLFDLLVIDEISRMRNPRGSRYKLLAKNVHRWKMIWGLSGTLRPSGAVDLFAPVRLVTRGKLWGTSFDKWRRQRFYHTDYEGHVWEPLPGGEEDRINAEIAPLVITGEIPPQPEPTVLLDRFELPTKARVEYDKMQKKLFAQVAEGDDGKVVADSRAISIGKLGQIANGFVYHEDGTTYRLHEGKREWLEDLIENAAWPTLLIYEYREDLAMIRELLGDELPYLGAGVTDKMAADNIDRWNKRELPFMALHPASGGHGLNLQFGGSDMAWISPTWDSEAWDQTLARLARSGQTEQVIVRVCVANRTVDDLKLDRVHGKLSSQEAFEKYLKDYAAA